MRIEVNSPSHLKSHLAGQSRVLVDLRAGGLFGAGHTPTLSARPNAWAIDVDEGPIDAALDIRFPAADIEPSRDMSLSDREKMLDNIRGPDVLDIARFPTVYFRGRYVGTLDGGVLSGDVGVRGGWRPISMDIRVTRTTGVAGPEGAAAVFEVRGAWEGRLSDLGIKPFRALLGALRLDNWVRLRLEGALVRPLTSLGALS